jgi:DNA-binding Xre family transcriptional regulator
MITGTKYKTMKLRNMTTSVIKWKLREIMARQKCTNKALATALDMHPKSVSRMKNMDRMPQLSHDRLNAICRKLGCDVSELLEYIPDEIAP